LKKHLEIGRNGIPSFFGIKKGLKICRKSWDCSQGHHFAGGQPVGEDQGLLSNGWYLAQHLVEHRQEPLALPDMEIVVVLPTKTGD
jgi:hypothetical protein